MQIFKNNEYPQRLFKSGLQTIEVANKKGLDDARADGWQDFMPFEEYPKWVGPHDSHVYDEIIDERGKIHRDYRVVAMGGKVVDNAKEEADHLAYLAQMEPPDDTPITVSTAVVRRGRPPLNKKPGESEVTA